MEIRPAPDLEARIQSRAQTGRYSSASEVVAEALRLMEEWEQLLELQKDEIRAQIEEGLADQRAGRLVDGETAFAELEAKLDALERSGRP